jgi:hypothetical protein
MKSILTIVSFMAATSTAWAGQPAHTPAAMSAAAPKPAKQPAAPSAAKPTAAHAEPGALFKATPRLNSFLRTVPSKKRITVEISVQPGEGETFKNFARTNGATKVRVVGNTVTLNANKGQLALFLRARVTGRADLVTASAR